MSQLPILKDIARYVLIRLFGGLIVYIIKRWLE